MVRILKASDIMTGSAETEYSRNFNKEELDSLKVDIIKQAEQEAEEIISNAKKLAGSIISNARNQCEMIIRDAKDQAIVLLEEAKSGGYSQGFAEGQEKAAGELKLAEQKANEIIQGALDERQKLLDDLKDEILSLSLSISEKILRIELDRNDEAFKSIVASALKKVSDSANVKVRISESDYLKYFSEDKDMGFVNDGSLNVTFVKDRMLKKGDCIIDSDSGTVDAGISTQLKQIKLAYGVNV